MLGSPAAPAGADLRPRWLAIIAFLMCCLPLFSGRQALVLRDDDPQATDHQLGNGAIYLESGASEQRRELPSIQELSNSSQGAVVMMMRESQQASSSMAGANFTSRPSVSADANITNQFLELDIFEAIEQGYFRHSTIVSVILTAAYTTVFVIGIVGNFFVVCIVCKSPRMRTVTNYFIANLALADILVLLFCLPATLISNLFIPYVLGLFVCKTVSYLQGVAVSASINTMVTVTMDRFLAICFPMDWHMSRRRARQVIACIWLFSLFISLPWALYFTLVPYKAQEDSPTIPVCAEDWPSERWGNIYFVCANLILLYLFPAVVIILCYLGIWYKIERRSIPGDRPKGLKIELIMQKSKLKVVKMMMVVVLMFLVSWLPVYLIFARIKLADERSPFEDWLISNLMPLAQWLGASNSCINPILYTFFNRKYKRGFIDLLMCSFCCRPSPTEVRDSTSSANHRLHMGNGAGGAGSNSMSKQPFDGTTHGGNNLGVTMHQLNSLNHHTGRVSQSSQCGAGVRGSHCRRMSDTISVQRNPGNSNGSGTGTSVSGRPSSQLASRVPASRATRQNVAGGTGSAKRPPVGDRLIGLLPDFTVFNSPNETSPSPTDSARSHLRREAKVARILSNRLRGKSGGVNSARMRTYLRAYNKSARSPARRFSEGNNIAASIMTVTPRVRARGPNSHSSKRQQSGTICNSEQTFKMDNINEVTRCGKVLPSLYLPSSEHVPVSCLPTTAAAAIDKRPSGEIRPTDCLARSSSAFELASGKVATSKCLVRKAKRKLKLLRERARRQRAESKQLELEMRERSATLNNGDNVRAVFLEKEETRRKERVKRNSWAKSGVKHKSAATYNKDSGRDSEDEDSSGGFGCIASEVRQRRAWTRRNKKSNNTRSLISSSTNTIRDTESTDITALSYSIANRTLSNNTTNGIVVSNLDAKNSEFSLELAAIAYEFAHTSGIEGAGALRPKRQTIAKLLDSHQHRRRCDLPSSSLGDIGVSSRLAPVANFQVISIDHRGDELLLSSSLGEDFDDDDDGNFVDEEFDFDQRIIDEEEEEVGVGVEGEEEDEEEDEGMLFGSAISSDSNGASVANGLAATGSSLADVFTHRLHSSGGAVRTTRRQRPRDLIIATTQFSNVNSSTTKKRNSAPKGQPIIHLYLATTGASRVGFIDGSSASSLSFKPSTSSKIKSSSSSSSSLADQLSLSREPSNTNLTKTISELSMFLIDGDRNWRLLNEQQQAKAPSTLISTSAASQIGGRPAVRPVTIHSNPINR